MYKVCGSAILVAIVLTVVVARVAAAKTLNPVFWLESIAVVAFGVSWLTKGEAILKDET